MFRGSPELQKLCKKVNVILNEAPNTMKLMEQHVQKMLGRLEMIDDVKSTHDVNFDATNNVHSSSINYTLNAQVVGTSSRICILDGSPWNFHLNTYCFEGAIWILKCMLCCHLQVVTVAVTVSKKCTNTPTDLFLRVCHCFPEENKKTESRELFRINYNIEYIKHH